MLPVGGVKPGRDWLEIFTIVVWGTAILIMFLAKLKAMQDVYVGIVLAVILAIINADTFFAKFKIYKMYMVLRRALFKDFVGTALISVCCLGLHGHWPEANAPGAILHLSALGVWLASGVQASPMVSTALYFGGRNLMTKHQLWLRACAQVCGFLIAFAAFGLYYSFALPGEGPFQHIISPVSILSALATFGGTFVCIQRREKKEAEKDQ